MALRGASTEEVKSRRKHLADQVTIELVRHSVAEEVLVYPQVEKKVSAEEAEHAREEHAEAEETLQRLEKLDADDPAFDDELATLMGEIRHHIADEEGEMFAHMRRPARTPTCRTSRSRGWRQARRHRSSTACAISPPVAAPATDRYAPSRSDPMSAAARAAPSVSTGR